MNAAGILDMLSMKSAESSVFWNTDEQKSRVNSKRPKIVQVQIEFYSLFT